MELRIIPIIANIPKEGYRSSQTKQSITPIQKSPLGVAFESKNLYILSFISFIFHLKYL